MRLRVRIGFLLLLLGSPGLYAQCPPQPLSGNKALAGKAGVISGSGLAGGNFSLTWQPCDKTFQFGGTFLGSPLEGWTARVTTSSEIFGLDGFTDPETKEVLFSWQRAYEDAFHFTFIHELMHVVIAEGWEDFDDHYKNCVGTPVQCSLPQNNPLTQPQLFPCYWAAEQIASCGAAVVICCALGASGLSEADMEELQASLEAAESMCALDKAVLPDAYSDCAAETKPPFPPENGTCPPPDCPTEWMMEFGEGAPE